MQLFEITKQLMAQLKREKAALLTRTPEREGSADSPVRLTLRLSPEYDEHALPVRAMKLGIATPNAPSRTLSLDVPEATLLRRDRDISDWLDTVLEFATCAQGMALERSVESINRKRDKHGAGPLKANAYKNPKEWELRIVQEQGALQALPLDSAMLQLDALAKLTLSGWREHSRDKRIMVKTFRHMEDAEQAKELLHLILLANGHDEMEMRRDIKYIAHPDVSRYQLQLPKRHLELARQAEAFLG